MCKAFRNWSRSKNFLPKKSRRRGFATPDRLRVKTITEETVSGSGAYSICVKVRTKFKKRYLYRLVLKLKKVGDFRTQVSQY